MVYRKSEMSSLMRRDPDRAKRELLNALSRNGGNVVWTAEHLGIGRITLRRWILRLEIEDAVVGLRKDWDGRRRRFNGRKQRWADA